MHVILIRNSFHTFMRYADYTEKDESQKNLEKRDLMRRIRD